MPATVERMSRVDTAWLRMDNDVNLMMIVGVWLLSPAIGYDALCKRVQDKLLKYGRFRQRRCRNAMGASWVDDAASTSTAMSCTRSSCAGRGRAPALRCRHAPASSRPRRSITRPRSGSST